MVDLSKSKTAWPIKVKLKRGLWSFVIQPLVRWLPKSCSPIRIWALRLMGASIGERCLILPGVKVLMPWNLKLAHCVAIGERVNIYNFAQVTIDRMTVVSQYCFLCTGSHDYSRGDMPLIYDPITIGSECWVAAGVFLAPGIQIPNGAVIGAMSVVSKELSSEWAVYAGNPCSFIKNRVMAD